MGATTFSQYALGKTVAEAFASAKYEAQYMHGHGGYSGTLAEKGSYVAFQMPARCSTRKLLDLIYEIEDFQSVAYMRSSLQYARGKTELRKREAEIRKEERRQAAFWRKHAAIAPLLKAIEPVYDDKWGPAVALEVNGTQAKEIKKSMGRAGTHDKVFLFCGWASC